MTDAAGSMATGSNAPILVEALNYSLWMGLLIGVTYAFLVTTSGRVVRRTLAYAGIEIGERRDEHSAGADAVESAGDGKKTTDGDDGGDSGVDGDHADQQAVDTGRAIGKLENVLVLTLMVMEAYTALGVIFAAKSLVRKDDMSGGDTSYYLTGTLANFTYSIAVGTVLHVVLWVVLSYGLF